MGFLAMAPSIVVLMVAAVAISQVNSLKCYHCQNCATVSSEQLMTCNITIIVPPTNPPPNPTDATISPASPTTDAPVPPTTDAPTTVSNIKESSTENQLNTTETSIPANATEPPINGTYEYHEEYEVFIAKRSVEIDDDLENTFADECFCQDGHCDCGEKVYFSIYDDIKVENLTFACVTDTVTINGTAITNRGCAIKANTTAETCVYSGFSQNCTTCETEGCNKPSSAFSIKLSAFLLLPLFLAFVKN